MKELIEKIHQLYANEVKDIKTLGQAELAIVLKKEVDSIKFSQNLQNHLIEMIDQETIVKVDIVDNDGRTVDSFATNQ